MAPDLLSGTLLGGRRRFSAKPVKPGDHHYCPLHPDRWLRGAGRPGAPKEPCWRCQMEGDSPLVDRAVFAELDALIAIGLESISQERITPEMIAARTRSVAQLENQRSTKTSVRETQESSDV